MAMVMVMITGALQHKMIWPSWRVFGPRNNSGTAQSIASSNILISHHARHGRLREATKLFDSMPQRDIISWNSIISAYAQSGHPDIAHRFFFDRMPLRNIVSWNSLISGYTQNGQSEKALSLYAQSETEGIKPNEKTFASLLSACSSLRSLNQGKSLHIRIVSLGFGLDFVVGNSLLSMYSKCGKLLDAKRVFDLMNQQNVVSWNAMIFAYAQYGYMLNARSLFDKMPLRNVVSWTTMIVACVKYEEEEEAFSLFYRMIVESVRPNAITFNSILDACKASPALRHGKMIHATLCCSGFDLDVVGIGLISMYARCASLNNARFVFDRLSQQNVASWTAMVNAYAKYGFFEDALDLFEKAPKLDTISQTSMIVALANNGCLNEARQVFDKMPQHDVVSWNAMISAYAQNGQGKIALQLFSLMQSSYLNPNKVTFIAILDACGRASTFEHGKAIHAYLVCFGFESDVILGTALVEMYGKCGCLDIASNVFSKLPQQNVILWTTLIAVYGRNGQGMQAVKLLKQMCSSGVKPNSITFISILSACSHAGLLGDGWCCFVSMYRDHGIEPTVDHYMCMVNLLGRAGVLDEAEGLILNMLCEASIEYRAIAWMCLLGACQIHGDMERGVRVAKHLLELNPKDSALYALINTCAACGKWDDLTKVIQAMKNEGVQGIQSNSCIEAKNMVHEFAKGDMCHPQIERICRELQRLSL